MNNLRKVIVYSDVCGDIGDVDIDYYGFFHCWGMDYEIDACGSHQKTVGIVEDIETGIVTKVNPEFIQFEKEGN